MCPSESVGTERPIASERETQETSEKRMQGGHDPREMARRSAEVRRQKKADEEAAMPPGTDTSDQAIVARLRRKAAKGDVSAARELREWIASGQGDALQGDAWMAWLTPTERQQVMDVIDLARKRHAPVTTTQESEAPHPPE